MDGDKVSGPYRATKLWNEAILMFREGMPVKKHRRHMKIHDSCFTGSEAITWFHSALQKNPNFGPDVTKEQAMQLLQKFLRAAVFEKISDKSSDTLEQFKDNNSLFKFCSRSPLKSMQLPNLMSRTDTFKKPAIPNLDSSPKVMRIPAANTSMDKKRFLEEVKAKAVTKQRTQLEVQEVWKSVVLGRLEALMEGVTLEDYIPSGQVIGHSIAANVENAAKLATKTLSRQLDTAKDFPNWMLAAMKTLTNWPEQQRRGALNQSGYFGFERDVLKEVEKYFNDVETPIIPVTFYKAFVHAFMYVEHAERLHQEEERRLAPHQHQENIPEDEYAVSSKSVENLVLGMSSPLRPSRTNPFAYPDFSPYQDPINSTNPFAEYLSLPQSQSFHHHQRSAATKDSSHHTLSMYQPQPLEQDSVAGSADDILSGSRILNTVLPPNSCFETAFTSESPTTRIIPQRTVDTLHFQRRPRARRSEAEIDPTTPSPIYVRMDMYRNPPAPVKRRGRGESIMTMTRSSTLGNLNLNMNRPSHARELSCQSDVPQGRFSTLDARYKRHSMCFPSAEHRPRPQSTTPLTTGELDGRPALPPKPPISKTVDDIIYENLSHMKNRSGGYVNLALSYEDGNQIRDDQLEDIAGEELDVPTAMKSIYTLMKCSQSMAHSTPYNDSAFLSPIPTRLSLSSIGSYHTAASDNSPIFRGETCQTVISRGLPELALPDNFEGVKSKKIGAEIMQLLLLILPPESRNKLSVLFSFLDAVAENRKLSLDENMTNKQVLAKSFKECVLSNEMGAMCAEETAKNEELKHKFFNFFMKEYATLLCVPPDLKDEVHQHIKDFQLEQLKSSEHAQRQQQWQKHRLEVRLHPHQGGDLKFAVQGNQPPDQPVLTYCEQVTSQQFEQQKFTGSQRALFELLEQIIDDPKMALKDKQKRLELFKSSYPHIYGKRFPTKEEEDKVLHPKSKSLLRTLSRLKNLRL